MVERDVVLAKVATIDRCLARIRDVNGPRAAFLTPIDVEDIVLLNLQRSVQATIDLAAHVASAEAYGPADSVGGLFLLLSRHGVLSPELADRLRRMVGFRNIAVHDYQAVDPQIVEGIVRDRLDDLRELATAILDRYGIA